MRTTSAAVLFLAGLCLGAGRAAAADRPRLVAEVGGPLRAASLDVSRIEDLAALGQADLQTSAAPAGAARDLDLLTLGVVGAGAADLATTEWALATVPGARDANPLVRGPASAVVVKLGMTAGVLLLDREFRRRGHPRAGKVLKIATIVVWGGCAAWNARQVARHGGAR
jgi:hypothetical protein